MKNNLTIKVLTIILALTLVFGVSLFLVGNKENKVMAANEEPTLSIDYVDLSLEDNVYIKFAVDTNDANTTLLVWTAPQDDYTFDGYVKGTENVELTNATQDTINEKGYVIFTYTQLSAKQMTDEIYVRAYNNGNYSNVVKYSILQYAYETLSESKEEYELIELLQNMLNYGASAQNYFGYKTERLANNPFCQVEIVGGTLLDGTTKGLYKSGEEINVSAPATNGKGESFLRWQNSAYKILSKESVATITVEDNTTITAIYGEESDYSEEEMYALYLKAMSNLEPDFKQDFAFSLLGNYKCDYTQNKKLIKNRTYEEESKNVLSFNNSTSEIYYIEMYSEPEDENKTVNRVEYVMPSGEELLRYYKENSNPVQWNFVDKTFVSQVLDENIYYVMYGVVEGILGEGVGSFSDLIEKEGVSNVFIVSNNDNTFTLSFDCTYSEESFDYFFISDDKELSLPCSNEKVESYLITFNENKLLSINVKSNNNSTAITDGNTYGIEWWSNNTIIFSDGYDSETIEIVDIQIPTSKELEKVEFLQKEVTVVLLDVGVFGDYGASKQVEFT